MSVTQKKSKNKKKVTKLKKLQSLDENFKIYHFMQIQTLHHQG